LKLLHLVLLNGVQMTIICWSSSFMTCWYCGSSALSQAACIAHCVYWRVGGTRYRFCFGGSTQVIACDTCRCRAIEMCHPPSENVTMEWWNGTL
jgi:hypothetical protein